jgi:hypothetical protein
VEPAGAIHDETGVGESAPAIEVRSLATAANTGREWRGAARQRRLRRLPVLLALGLSGGIVAIAFTGPRLSARPELDLAFLVTPPPSPSPTPEPSYYGPAPTPTPLPRLTYGLGERPTGPVLLDLGQGIQRFDPVTGELSAPTAGNAWENLFIRDAAGGYLCVCMIRTNDGAETMQASIGTLSDEGVLSHGVPLATFKSSGTLNDSQVGTSVDAEVSADQRDLYLATGIVAPGSFTIHVDAVDTRRQVLVDRLDVVRLPLPESDPKFVRPTPSPGMDPPQAWPNGPGVRLSPDGRHLLVWGWIDRWDPAVENPPTPARAWLVDLDPTSGRDRFGRVHELTTDLLQYLRNCGAADWIDETRIVTNCQVDGSTGLQFQIFGLDGRLQRSDAVANTGDEGWGGELLIDRVAKRMWIWTPGSHQLAWLDVPDGQVQTTVVDRLTQPGPVQGAPVPMARSVEWDGLGSAMWRFSGSIIGSPDGSRIFALGRRTEVGLGGGGRGGAQGSTGIWVFDARTGGLVDHWAPATSYANLSISHDGEWVMAVGEPQVDADGNATSWTGSLTFHKIDTGEIGLRLSGFDDPQAWVGLLP